MNTYIRDNLNALRDGTGLADGAVTAAKIAEIGSTVFIEPLSSFSNVNWNSINFTTTYAKEFALESTGAQNAEVTWRVLLQAGTWKFTLMHSKAGNRGIYSVQIDGVEGGTIDGFAAAAANALDTITGISVANSGLKTLKLKMATKNASSSSFFGVIIGILMIRTA